MNLSGIRIGFGITGSFCTFAEAFEELENLAATGASITPVLSYAARDFDTRFGKAADHRNRVECICGTEAIDTIAKAEPIGPRALLDLMIVCPCTGNTLAKIANGITDTPVTMAVKAHLRNQRPVLLALASNDSLAANAKNLGAIMNTENIYLLPMRQDSPEGKPTSLVAENALLLQGVEKALQHQQMQPVLLAPLD